MSSSEQPKREVMFQSTSSSGYSNGYHHGGGSGNGSGGTHVAAHRLRRGCSSRSRDYGSGSNLRVSNRMVQQQKEEDEDTATDGASNSCTGFDMAYFHSYAHLGVHEEMIKDRPRTESYRNAIFQHQDRIAGKVVVDVGCGTGILSIFCAHAGAKRVYAVDASNIAVQANEVVKANNLSDTVIVLHGRVEDVEIDEEVDVIVSEWMGYMLLYESMLGSVITARDRWLKPGGLILPSTATLYLALVTHPDRYSESIDFWRNVYGIDMSAMLPLAKQCAFEEPSIETITGENVLSWPHVVKHVDCYTVTLHELESVSSRFKFKSMMRAPFHGFAFWFDVDFGIPVIYPPSDNNTRTAFVESPDNHNADGNQRKKRAIPNEALVLSTAPEDPSTHWQQALDQCTDRQRRFTT
ncbi:probable protein arginine N-methyltransferase 6 isoform X2 [Olea europaea var. sylvestris]|uniref:probable protein arginine N-methyltransferase 6 isoform X2 n=1 Tax=Olea europaea var. sylvestris TaxID=158386 RepID=UPI000C1D3433|nr:probable protein arginine N-methyltransferase 6 isoform X2 [Olea europaea var. sylvestris]